MEISVDGEQIILQKRADLCLFCGAESPAIEYRGRRLCDNCAAEVGQRVTVEVRLPDTETTEPTIKS